MAKFNGTDVSVTINSVDLSDHIANVTIQGSFEELDTTSVTDTYRTRIAGVGDAEMSLEFHQDFAASSVNATIHPLLGQTTTVAIKHLSSATSATNPEYSGTALVLEWPILDVSAGDLATSSVTWPVSGGWTEATS